MRIRSIRPEFWASEDIAAMSWETRLVFIGLWSYVDDNGVGRDDARLITAALFPLDDDFRESLRRVSGALQHLSEHGQVQRYDVEGRSYLHVCAWAANQRVEKAAKARYPPPTSGNARPRETLATPSGDPPETLPPGEGEKGRRGEGEKRTTPLAALAPAADAAAATSKPTATPPGFDEFWSRYPRKADKQAALRAWPKARKAASIGDLVAGATRYRDDPNRDASYTKLPATWLNAGSWSDEPLPPRGGRQTITSKLQQGAELARRLHAEEDASILDLLETAP